MGCSIKDEAKKFEQNVSLKRGISKSILDVFGNDDELMEKVLSKMEYLISNKLAISDDILLSCWKYDSMRTWNVLKTSINKICDDNTLHDSDWYWYKMYIANSAIWYEPHEKQFDSDDENDHEVRMKTEYVKTEPKSKKIDKRTDDHGDQEVAIKTIGNDDNYIINIQHDVAVKTTRREQESKENSVVTSDDDYKDEVKTNVLKADSDIAKRNKKTHKVIMYDNLISIVNKTLNDKEKQLFNHFKELKKTQYGFDSMVRYDEYIVNDKEVLKHGLRQDNDKLFTFPNKFKFINHNNIHIPNVKTRTLESTHLYDLHIYLPSLKTVAHTLNNSFHYSVKKIVQKCSYGGSCSYTAHPIKDISRLQAEVENNYQLKPFPTSANVIDLLSASVIYDDCRGLIKGLKGIIKIIDENKDNYCIKKVLQIRNTFIKNKKRDPQGWMKLYGDIKLNVLIENNGVSMIGEIKILLKMHDDHKKGIDKLCQIKKNEEFIHNDMKSVLQLLSKSQENFFTIIQSQNTDKFAQVLFNNYDEINCCKLDINGLNAFHYCCKFGNVRMLQLLIDKTKNDSKCKDWLKIKTKEEQYCLHLAVESCSIQVVDTLLDYAAAAYGHTKTDFSIQGDQDGYTPLKYVLENENSDNIEMVKLLVEKGNVLDTRVYGCEIKKDPGNPLHIAAYQGNPEILEYLLKLKHCGSNMVNEYVYCQTGDDDDKEGTPLSWCIKSYVNYSFQNPLECDNFKCIELLLKHDAIFQDSNGSTILSSVLLSGTIDLSLYFLDKYYQQGIDGFILDKDFQDNNGDNYLTLAAEYSNFQILSKIIELNAFNDINHTNKVGDSALYIAADRLIFVKNKVITRKGLDFKRKYAKLKDAQRCFDLLLKQNNIDINVRPCGDKTILTKLIMEQLYDQALYILNHAQVVNFHGFNVDCYKQIYVDHDHDYEYGQYGKLKLKCDEDDEDDDHDDDEKQLELESIEKSTKGLLFLLDKSFQNFCYDLKGYNYLTLAARYGNFKILSKIIELNAFDYDADHCAVLNDEGTKDNALSIVSKRLEGSRDYKRHGLKKIELEQCYQLLVEKTKESLREKHVNAKQFQ